MIKILFIFFISCIASGYSLAQNASKNNNPKAGSTITTGIETPAPNKLDSVSKKSGTPDKLLLDVLFATNESCDLYIGETFKGTVKKSEHTFLALAPGTYTYKVISNVVLEAFEESFSVKEGALNEIFIDFLYFIDEINEQRKNGKDKKKVKEQPTAKTWKIAVTATPEETNNQAAQAAIKALVSNMVLINGGSFIMGNNKAPSADEVEHTVSVNSIHFSKYEVTQEQWESIMGNNPSSNKGCSTCPVENVSWEEAMKFISKVNVLSNKKFRLPTEAEWEYAARIGGKEEIDMAGGPEEFIKKTAWYYANADKKTHPVGQKQPNIEGIYDLLGNVSEWCSDWYAPDYYNEETSYKNPEGPPLGKEKVVRGGSFVDFSGDRFRPSLRDKLKPTGKSPNIGFRLVLEQL